MENKNIQTGVIIALLVVIVTVSVAFYESSTSTQQVGAPINVVNHRERMMSEMHHSIYEDGRYTAEGEYISPGGQEHIGVSLTLENGIISDVMVMPKAVLDISRQKQADFAAHYKPFVVGKNIDEVELGRVSGSSLTPKGFNDAISKIKQQAKS